MPAVETSGLQRRFGDNLAVAGVDLAVEEGEIYGFLGPNGAGKSTTTRMLCTLTAPTGGTATVAGFDVARQPDAVRLRIGVALQSAALDETQTGTELLRQQGRYYGLSRAEIDRRLAELRELIDIGEAIDQRIKGYSGGMKRRLDLAASLIHNPEVLFLDEPTTGLDPVSRGKVWEEVRRLNTELGMTIFLTTQYLEEADVLAHRVGIIDHGRIVAEGTPVELKRSIGADVVIVEVDDPDAARRAIERVSGIDKIDVHGDEVTVATGDGPAAVAPIVVALEKANVRALSLTLREPTLDDVFLELTGNRMEEEAA
jgi:ABC-2 type transport system ATP-binding protein